MLLLLACLPRKRCGVQAGPLTDLVCIGAADAKDARVQAGLEAVSRRRVVRAMLPLMLGWHGVPRGPCRCLWALPLGQLRATACQQGMIDMQTTVVHAFTPSPTFPSSPRLSGHVAVLCCTCCVVVHCILRLNRRQGGSSSLDQDATSGGRHLLFTFQAGIPVELGHPQAGSEAPCHAPDSSSPTLAGDVYTWTATHGVSSNSTGDNRRRRVVPRRRVTPHTASQWTTQEKGTES